MMSFALFCLVVGILIFCPEADCGSLTWYEPPPTLTVQTGGIPVDHLSSRQLQEGSINASLSWQFNLTELNFIFWTLLFDKIPVALAYSLGPVFQPGFESQFGIDWIPDQTFVRLVIFNITSAENGAFTCQVVTETNSSTLRFKSYVQVDVVAPPSNIITSSDLNVTAPAELTLNCSADGKPKPTITWTRVSNNTFVVMPIKFTGGKDKGRYRCTAANGVGKPINKDVFVDVHVPQMVTLASKGYVGQSTTATPTSTTPKSNGTTSALFTTKATSAETGGSAGPQWAVIGSVAGGIVVVVIVVVVVSWWVHKQRKCRKDIKIGNSDMELRQGVEGRYLQVQCAQSGPPVANRTDSALWRKSDYR